MTVWHIAASKVMKHLNNIVGKVQMSVTNWRLVCFGYRASLVGMSNEEEMNYSSDSDSDIIFCEEIERPQWSGQDGMKQEGASTSAKAMGNGGAAGDDSNVDSDNGAGIRIRNDGIFEQEDEESTEGEEEEEEETQFFPAPPGPMPYQNVTIDGRPIRKRKQDLMSTSFDSELAELMGLQDFDDDDEPIYTLDPAFLSPSKKRDPDRLPLYLRNPDDYAHDPKKQVQIRRAIITYRHHQDKKEQIIKLTEENKMLREHNRDLKKTIADFSRLCMCDANIIVKKDVMNVVIPATPPRQFIRGNKPVLAVPYNGCPVSPTSFQNMSTESVDKAWESLDDGLTEQFVQFESKQGITATATVPNPVISIASNRTPQINSSSLSTNTFVSTTNQNPKPSATIFDRNTKATVANDSVDRNTNRFLISKPGTRGAFPHSSTSTVPQQAEQGPAVAAANSLFKPINQMLPVMISAPGTTKPIPIVAKAISISTKAVPGTSASCFSNVSGIMFPAQSTSTSAQPRTASQLLFAIKPGGTTRSNGVKEQSIPATSSQAKSKPVLLSKVSSSNQSSHSPPVTTQIQSVSGQIFQTASGHVLKLIPAPAPRPTTSTTTFYQPILPKPAPQSGSLIVVSQSQPKQVTPHNLHQYDESTQEMWRRYEEKRKDDDDDDAIIEFIKRGSPPRSIPPTTATVPAPAAAPAPPPPIVAPAPPTPQPSPPKHKRKQRIAKKGTGGGRSQRAQLQASLPEEIDLAKYQDIVFEVAE